MDQGDRKNHNRASREGSPTKLDPAAPLLNLSGMLVYGRVDDFTLIHRGYEWIALCAPEHGVIQAQGEMSINGCVLMAVMFLNVSSIMEQINVDWLREMLMV